MTAIFYPDREAVSDSGRFTLEACSPHNGTISHRDGRMATQDEFGFKYREHQSEFRYRLLDHEPRRPHGRTSAAADSKVVWERFQGERENSPHELLVSDDGWSVIRTHGFAPEVIAVGLGGQDALRVRITGDHGEEDKGDRTGHSPGPVWALSRLSLTTAGHYWSLYSWPGFFRRRDDTYFTWRAWWGQRLVLDLGRAIAFTDEQLLPDELSAGVIEFEKRSVRALLGDLSPRMEEVRALRSRKKDTEDDNRNPLQGRVRQASSALHLAGVHRLRDCVPFLREWESLDFPSGSRGSSAMPGPWWCQTQSFRPIVHHALKLLGEEPQGFPTYAFIAGEFRSPERFPMPERVPDRRGRAARLNKEMSAEDVLKLLGSPDFIRRRSRKVDRFCHWSEDWEYDFRDGTKWTTLRINWEEERRTGRMAAIEEITPYWFDPNEREAEFLGL